jgi:isopenicillin N synthase-like dioxygenase
MASKFIPPIIDVAGLRSNDKAAIASVVTAFREACTETGFFYISNHGVPDSVVEEALAASKNFFAQPLPFKRAIGFDNNRGYDGMGRQILDHSIGGDMKESALFGVELTADHPLVKARLPNHVVNPWPPLPGFREAIQAYFNSLHKLSLELLNGLALSLELPWDFFEPHFDIPMSSVRLLHYPSHPDADPSRSMGAAAHTDWGLITLLLQDQTGGLQVKLPGGEWIDATPVPGTFVVNMGDMMARWTNDVYTSTPHRVMNKSTKDRYSIAFFCDPGYYTKVECLPGCRTAQRPPRYAPTTCGAHLQEMYTLSYGATG